MRQLRREVDLQWVVEPMVAPHKTVSDTIDVD